MRVDRLLLTVAGVALAWAVALALFGGINTTIAGIAIRSNNPNRVLLIAVLAFAGYFLAGGRIRRDTVLRPWRWASRAATALARRPALIAASIASALVMTAAAGSTRIAGGADAYGYVSQADLWLAGGLRIDQPWVSEVPWPDAEWTFSPLGYRPHPTREGAIVPTYAPGLPMLMAAAKAIAGQCGLFAVLPLLAGLGVLATFGIGRRLGAEWEGVAAAWLVATSPVVIGSAMEPLTDVPVMSMWATAFYFALAPAGSRKAIVLAGLSTGLAILIRPNLVPLAAPLGLWYLVQNAMSSRTRIVDAGLFSLAVLPAIVLVAILNARLYGSPAASGYGRLEELFAWAHVVPNVQRYLAWFAHAQTPLAFAGIAALLVPILRLWPTVSDRRAVTIMALFVVLLWAQYFAYLVFDSWGYLRFLLPSWPFIMLGVAAVIFTVHRRVSAVHPAIAVVLTTAILITLGARTANVGIAAGVFDQRQAAAHEAPIGQLVRAYTRDNSLLLVWERSGSMRYYSGRTTLRYDHLDAAWLDRAVEWFRDRGVHVYAVLDPGHVEQCQRKFAGQKTAAAFDRPVLLYEPSRTALYDLTTPPAAGDSLIVVSRDPGGRASCDPPATPAPIVLR